MPHGNLKTVQEHVEAIEDLQASIQECRHTMSYTDPDFQLEYANLAAEIDHIKSVLRSEFSVDMDNPH